MKTKPYGIERHRTKLKRVLRTLKKRGIVMWEGDDSPEAYLVLKKVAAKIFGGGGRCLQLTSGQAYQLVPEKSWVCAGKFLAFYE